MDSLTEAEAFLEQKVAAQRHAATIALASKGAALRSFLFDKELVLADDLHRYVTACCGRRSGKSTTMAEVLLETALKTSPRFSVLYLSLTQGHAKGVIWGPLKALNEQYGLGGKPNEADLTMTMPNGVVIAINGVDKRKEIEKRRGYGFALVVIDECQSIPEHVKTLVDEVIEPALMDAPGKLYMIGTPSLVRGGYWFECHHNDKRGVDGQTVWGHHAWTVHSNPHIKNPDAIIAEVLARRGVDITHPSIRREYFGEWVRDESSAVFSFDAARNSYQELPAELERLLWEFVIAVDIGGGVERDNDAISVLAFHPHARATWLTEEHISPKQDVTGLAQKVKAIYARLGESRVQSIVADTGGIGAKVVEEMRRRHDLPITAAKKADKWANIELLNAACRHGEFYARSDSSFAAESVKVEKDWDKSTPERIAIKGHMPDCVDSVLYGFVESWAWVSERPAAPGPPEGTPEWAAEEARRMAAAAERSMKEKTDPDAWTANDEDAWEQARGGW